MAGAKEPTVNHIGLGRDKQFKQLIYTILAANTRVNIEIPASRGLVARFSTSGCHAVSGNLKLGGSVRSLRKKQAKLPAGKRRSSGENNSSVLSQNNQEIERVRVRKFKQRAAPVCCRTSITEKHKYGRFIFGQRLQFRGESG
ncbi:hypothetical protein PIB30_026832 [Stylosanthes scabra]|uniref:Uncharacterized protein n=1 Tax=Stylosanthes scabra TaxID=79078 RepID=A0ABU6RAU2_9FABA|nr:hypothetical protein [Stylosanthes scabra]